MRIPNSVTSCINAIDDVEESDVGFSKIGMNMVGARAVDDVMKRSDYPNYSTFLNTSSPSFTTLLMDEIHVIVQN